jgi:DNA-directed RNA polymerase subunit M/transcription elongation factor TFIIS
MGAGFRYKCDRCGYSISTSGPWEFYRDVKGNRKPYGHPVPTSEEAKERGIYGLSAELYCPKCAKTFDLILVEFTRPSRDSLSVWAGGCEPRDEFKRKDTVKCPECGGTNMILAPTEGEDVVCPSCKEGKLLGDMRWIA